MSYFSNVSSSVYKGANQTPALSAQDNQIKQLYKQRAKLQEELHSVNANTEMDSKLKMERVKTLTYNIQQLDTQISELKTEKFKPKTSETKSAEPEAAPSKSELDPHLVAIIEKSASYDQLSNMVRQRKGMESSIRKLENEVLSDRKMMESDPNSSDDIGKTLMLENAENTVYKNKSEASQEIRSQIQSMDKKIGELVTDINETNRSEESPSSSNQAVPQEDTDAPTNAANVFSQ